VFSRFRGSAYWYLSAVKRAAAKWTFTPSTRNSTFDNPRPIISKWNDPRKAIVWMRNAYVHNRRCWTGETFTGKVRVF